MNSDRLELASVKTKVIATVGPASESEERLSELMAAGVDVFRLNMAHGKHQWLEGVVARIRNASARRAKPVAILADLGGPKIRLGEVAGGSVQCVAGERFRFVRSNMKLAAVTPAVSAHAAAHDLTSIFEPLIDELGVGDLVLLSDGTVSMRVEAKGDGFADCIVEQAGEIRSGGGINLPGVELQVAALTDKDRDDLGWAVGQGIDFVGLSFVRRAADVRELREELRRLGSHAQIVAKIEKPQAVAAIDDIIRVTDAIMVARGDLGVEIDVARIAVVQKDIIRRCHSARVPVITATQMLESMRTNRLPTRAEATDVANAILDGTDAVMLSAETAVGQFPVEAVAMMNRIARETEPLLEPRFGRTPRAAVVHVPPITEALVEGASRIAGDVAAKLAIVATFSGNTALVLSKQRMQSPILGVSHHEPTVRRMCLYWGVTPLVAPDFRDPADLLHHVTDWATERGLLKHGDRTVLIAGANWTTTGHNMIVVNEVT